MTTGRPARSPAEMRRHRRRPLSYNAMVYFEDMIPVPCALRDVSESGARLTFEDVPDVPDSFVLMLSESGATNRNCRVVWRADKEVGVQFERTPPPKRAASPR